MIRCNSTLLEILHYQKNKITEIEAMLICFWEFDGHTGHSSSKQQYSSKNTNDERLLAIGLCDPTTTNNWK